MSLTRRSAHSATAVVDVAVDRLESSAFTSQLMALVAWEHVQGVLADFDGDFARAPEQLQGLLGIGKLTDE